MSEKALLRSGDTSSMIIEGPMTLATVSELYGPGQEALDGMTGHVTMDLGKVSGVDSSGLALLLEWKSMMDRSNRELRIQNVPDDLLRLAKLCAAQQLLGLQSRNSTANPP